MRVLVTGSGGYIGSLMAPVLAARGHEVVGLDTNYFIEARLGVDADSSYPVIVKDLRHVTASDVAGFDAVVHLAGLSNDALGQLATRVTYDINHHAAVRLAALARDAGVSRFLYSSSCSVYGRSDADLVSETSPVSPQTAYAECKVLDEREIGKLATDRFSPTFLRNATAYGASPRMRFDLVVNQLAGFAWTTRQLTLTSDGTPWRPLVHVRDICEAFATVLDSPRELVHNEVFNVGRSDANYRIKSIAETLAEVFPGCEVTLGAPDADQRSYRVDFEKIHRQLSRFTCAWELRRGAVELRDFYAGAPLTDERFGFRAFTRIKQLKYLLESKQIDEHFFWTHADVASIGTADLARRAGATIA